MSNHRSFFVHVSYTVILENRLLELGRERYGQKTINHAVEFRKSCEIIGEYVNIIEEIRIRSNMPMCLLMKGEEYYLSKDGALTRDEKEALSIQAKEVGEIFNHICDYSPYAYIDELKQGYLTVSGGHRIGVAGQALVEGEEVVGMKYISFLNIRVAHEILGVAKKVLPYLYKDGSFLSTLIISAPRGGKTTLLRDLVKELSDGNEFSKGVNVGVVDERSEIAGCFMGIPQNHVGQRTDVLDACPKTKGMMMMIRSMSPDIIAIDELGTSEDVQALKKVIRCGCQVLVTIHGTSYEEVRAKKEMKELINEHIFERYLILYKNNSERMIDVLDREGEKYA